MRYYVDFISYINCDSDIKAKIARIENIINALEDAELRGATNSEIEEYQYDDGQIKIRTLYRDLASISDTIEKLERRKQRLQNQCVGYRYNLRDGNVKPY